MLLMLKDSQYFRVINVDSLSHQLGKLSNHSCPLYVLFFSQQTGFEIHIWPSMPVGSGPMDLTILTENVWKNFSDTKCT